MADPGDESVAECIADRPLSVDCGAMISPSSAVGPRSACPFRPPPTLSPCVPTRRRPRSKRGGRNDDYIFFGFKNEPRCIEFVEKQHRH
jgi:hypothetical protein